MQCKNCGAEIRPQMHYCPYCGSTNELAEKQEYDRRVNQVGENLKALNETGEQVYRAGKDHYTKRMLVIAAIVIGFLSVIILNFTLYEKWEERKWDRQAYAHNQWKQTEYPILDELFASGDYQAVYERMFGDENGWESAFDWAHYGFIMDFYVPYEKMQNFREEWKKGIDPGKLKYEFEDAYYAAVFLLGTDLEQYQKYNNVKMTEMEETKISEYRQEASVFALEELGFTMEELEALYRKNCNYGVLDLGNIWQAADQLIQSGRVGKYDAM